MGARITHDSIFESEGCYNPKTTADNYFYYTVLHCEATNCTNSEEKDCGLVRARLYATQQQYRQATIDAGVCCHDTTTTHADAVRILYYSVHGVVDSLFQTKTQTQTDVQKLIVSKIVQLSTTLTRGLPFDSSKAVEE